MTKIHMAETRAYRSIGDRYTVMFDQARCRMVNWIGKTLMHQTGGSATFIRDGMAYF